MSTQPKLGKRPELERMLRSACGKHLLLKKDHFKNNVINMTCAFGIIALAWTTCVFSTTLQSLPAILLIALVFGWIFFSLFIVVVHEASHANFIRVGNKRANKWLNRLIAYPITALSFQDYYLHWEKGHMEHHRGAVEERDPQNCPSFCLSGKELYLELLKVNLIPLYAGAKQNECAMKRDKAGVILGNLEGLVVWGALAAYCHFSLNRWEFILGFILASNISMSLNLLKVSMEHGKAAVKNPGNKLNTKSSLFAGRWLLMPFNISLHFEHHLAPNIPWYRLGRLHREFLMLSSPEVQNNFYNLGTVETIRQIRGISDV